MGRSRPDLRRITFGHERADTKSQNENVSCRATAVANSSKFINQSAMAMGAWERCTWMRRMCNNKPSTIGVDLCCRQAP